MKTSKTVLLSKLGENVRMRRRELNLSQEQFAEVCGFDRTYISLVERGKRNVSFSNLKGLANGLGITVSDLTRGM